MKLENLKDHLKNKKELVPTVLLGVSVLCGILILVKVTSFFVASARAESVVKRAIEQNRADPKNTEKQLASSAAITDELKKNNLFAPPPPKQQDIPAATAERAAISSTAGAILRPTMQEPRPISSSSCSTMRSGFHPATRQRETSWCSTTARGVRVALTPRSTKSSRR